MVSRLREETRLGKKEIEINVSIITANYNCAEYLETCIKSVASQDCHEHIIVDDCSKDKSYKNLKKWAKKYKHIKLHKAPGRLKCGSA